MNMTTNIDNIPLKTDRNNIQDDSNDPIVKDILNEFQEEVKNIEKPEYAIKYQSNPQPPPPIYMSSPRPIQPKPDTKQSLYNEELIRKTSILVIIIAMIFSPMILPALINKLPVSIAGIIENYQFYFKLLLAFIVIYLMLLKKLV